MKVSRNVYLCGEKLHRNHRGIAIKEAENDLFMKRIFISYKRLDKDKVFKIKDQIEAAIGPECWIDLDGIESDAIFASKIIGAINSCEVFLYMYSKAHGDINDYENDWTIRELSFAQEKRKRIVFINIDGSELTDWFKLLFGTKQQVDGCSPEAIEKLSLDLGKWLGVQPQTKSKVSLPKSKLWPYKIVSAVISVLFCALWMYISGEYASNPPLSFFAVFASSIGIAALSGMQIEKTRIVSKLPLVTILVLLVAFIFFATYSCLATALSFMGKRYMELNLPSVPFAILAAVSVTMLMRFKKLGYYLLWACAVALSLGSYWWLMRSIYTPIIMMLLSCVLMLAFTMILMIKKDGVSLWKDMR